MSFIQRFSCGLFIVAVAAVSISAQNPEKPLSSKADTKTPADFSQEPVIVEYIHESMRYENDGSGTRELQSRMRVQTSAGLTVAGQLIFQYNALDDELTVKSVKVLKKDGTVVTAGPEAVQDLNAPVAREAPMYTDTRQKHVTVPGLSVGDTVEYDVAVKAKPLFAGQFWRTWTFTNTSIVLEEQLELNAPADRELKIKSPAGMEPTIKVERDRRIYRWATMNLKTPPPVDLFKGFTFNVVALLGGQRPAPPPQVMFSTFQDWNEVAAWYAQLERERRLPGAEIRAQADEIVRGLKDDEAKARALYYWVSQNIRYVSLSFGAGRYQPHGAGEVLSNRYGDCKDKTTLLESMLEAEGLHARPVLVSLHADIDPAVPNPMQFDHVIAQLQLGGQEQWLDTTVGVGPFGYLLPGLRDKDGLVVGEGGSSGLRRTPREFPFAAEYHIKVEGKVDAQGTLDADVELQTRSDLEVLVRLYNQIFSNEQLAKTAISILSRSNRFLYGTVQYSDFKVANAADTSVPVVVQFHVSGKPMFVNPKASQAQIMASLSSGLMAQAAPTGALPLKNERSSAEEIQAKATDLHGPRSYSLNLALTFSDLAKSDPPPEREFQVKQDFAAFTSRDSWDGPTLHVVKSLELRVPAISAKDFGEYEAFVKKIADAFPPPPKVETKTPAATPKSQPAEAKYLTLPEARDLFARGQDEAKRKNWANAIEAFAAATKADPKFADAWRELGRAQMYARHFPEAESAFRKYLEVAPNDHLAYLNMAWVLYDERKFEEDRDLMLKRIAAVPDDGDALFRLGAAYLALNQPEKAVPVLERSVLQFPKYVTAHMQLARAYLETNQGLLAQESLRKAVALDTSENTLNSAAYLFAEHRAYLDLAEEWSQRSIAVVEKELNDISLREVQSNTWALVARLSAYWDTLGWIKFQDNKLDAAKPFLLAAFQLNDSTTISYHLGRIFEAKNQTDNATELYLTALSALPSNEPLNDDAKDARKRLADFLGSDGQVDERVKTFHRGKSALRTVNIANSGGDEGIAQYTMVLDANAQVIDLRDASGGDSLANLADTMRASTMPQTFPDTTLKKLPRMATLACVASGQPCTLTLLPVGAIYRMVTNE